MRSQKKKKKICDLNEFFTVYYISLNPENLCFDIRTFGHNIKNS